MQLCMASSGRAPVSHFSSSYFVDLSGDRKNWGEEEQGHHFPLWLSTLHWSVLSDKGRVLMYDQNIDSMRIFPNNLVLLI